MANFQHAERYGLTMKLYRLEGVGKEVYINVNSATLLQAEKQQPGQTISQVGR